MSFGSQSIQSERDERYGRAADTMPVRLSEAKTYIWPSAPGKHGLTETMAAGAGVSRIERALVFDITGPGISNCLQWPHGPAHRSKAGRCCSLPRAGNRPPRYRSFRVTITACPGSWPLSYLALAAASTSPRYWSNRSAGSSRCV